MSLRRRTLLTAVAAAGTGCAPWPAAPHFVNPVLGGDRPDPTVLKDGPDYWLTHSSFESVPGLVIWHSRDLVHWQPRTAALRRYIGSVWAPELVKHDGRYWLYVPAKQGRRGDTWVLTAPHPMGPWSDPWPLGLDRIDPGHAVDEDGRRWLFVNGGDRVPLAADGLSLAGPLEHVYGGWDYPEHWDVESRSQEGPKLLRHGGWWHMVLALGGTAGPPTGHMVVAARARTLAGPWENAPHNPLVRTVSAAERWWSRGHATLVEGPAPGDWYLLYHGYENGHRTLRRQMLLHPVRWRADGWFESRVDDIAGPLPVPRGGQPVPHGQPLDDDFTAPALGLQWGFFRGGDAGARVRVGGGVLELAARGQGPADGAPLCFIAPDRHIEVTLEVEIDDGARAGLLLFYSERLYAGVGFDAGGFWLHRYGTDQRRGTLPPGTRRLEMRLTLREHILTVHTRAPGAAAWVKYGTQMEVSGYHHNVAGGFLSLRPALYAAGEGAARFRRLRYRALPG